MTLDKKSPYIWNRDQLRAFLKHPSEDVQRWAAEHIILLYPDLLDEVLAFLPDATQVEAKVFLDILEELPLPESAAPVLLEVFRHTSHPFYQAKEAVLLARCGYILPDHELDKLSLPYLFSYTEDGFRYLMRRIFTRRPPDKEGEFYYTLSAGIFSEDFYEFLSETTKSKNKDGVLDDLGLQYGQPLPKVLRARDSASALRLLIHALEIYASVLSSASGAFTAFTVQLDQAYERCRLLAESVRVFLERGGRLPSHLDQVLLAAVLGLTRDSSCRRILTKIQPSHIDFWSAVTMRDWSSFDLDPATLNWLRSQDENELYAGLETLLNNQGWNYPSSAFACLASATLPARRLFLLNALDREGPEDISGDVIQALRRSGPEAVKVALEYWKDQLPFNEDITWLEAYPTPEVVRFLLDNFENFAQADEVHAFFDTLAGIGSADFFEPLIKEWRPGEPETGERIILIAELNGIQDERLKPIVSEVKEAREKELTLTSSGGTGALLMDASVPLRCTACGRTYSYQLKTLYLDQSDPEVIIGDIIQCKGCGSVETFEKTSASYIALTEMLLAEAAFNRSNAKRDIESPFKGALQETEVGGKKLKTVAEAYHFFNEALEKEPQNIEYRRRFGNLLKNGGRPDLAIVQYREALTFNGEDIESAYLLAEVLVDQKKYREAMPIVEKVADLLRMVKIEKNREKVFFNALIMLANIIFSDTGRRVRLRPAGQLAQEAGNAGGPRSETVAFDYTDTQEIEEAFQLFESGQFTENQLIGQPKMPRKILTGEMKIRTGRNDPCPCGSGKKYKKCHGVKT